MGRPVGLKKKEGWAAWAGRGRERAGLFGQLFFFLKKTRN
jgi:hypothetical protein